MFIGHQAVAFGAKRFAPGTSLGTLLLGVMFLDLLWPVFLLLGIEHVRIAPGITAFTPLDLYDYPYSHSLLFALIWSAALGAAYATVRRYARGAWVVGGCVLSHWILDAIVHRPDMPLYPGSSTLIGLGLWQSIPGTFVVEGALFALCLALYLRSTSARGVIGHVSLWSFVLVLLASYVAGVGTPPPNESVLAWVSLSAWLFVAWGYWIDRNRNKISGV